MRLLEHYCSTQGEGPRTGIPTQFVRFAGCNLRCAGWACDTPFAIEPKIWRKEAQRVSAASLLGDIEKCADRYKAKNICLTGGEPLLQPAEHLLIVAREAFNMLGCTIEMFTNGSRPIPLRLVNWCTFVMDWKLPGSGETFSAEYDRNRYDNVMRLACAPERLGTLNSIKFVCKDMTDLDEAKQTYRALSLDQWVGYVYFGVVWDSDFSAAQLVQNLLDDPPGPWRLNIQTHNFIWSVNERRR